MMCSNIGAWRRTGRTGKVVMLYLAKLLQQYAVNEIAKLALSADGKMVTSDLGREYNTGVAMGIIINLWMGLACKTTEGGARTYVLAALTPSSEHGAHYTNYETEEKYRK
ncbi:hypothetical protein BELL_0706g00050 [Botrytis elliptica]|uniref:Uncharacterized protein n=1 Tax=Botrytis elliptica TaxID=278938 RepID=A0A4Z1JBD8_9HELO|nr:hypothetical protein BELL_0706g00050 [Botrytis elliptica]